MKLLQNGKSTLKLEITNISEHGFWMFIKGKEYFISFAQYPWFKDARIASLLNVKLIHNHHLYWPDLDVDLTTEIIADPDKYPLTYK